MTCNHTNSSRSIPVVLFSPCDSRHRRAGSARRGRWFHRERPRASPGASSSSPADLIAPFLLAADDPGVAPVDQPERSFPTASAASIISSPSTAQADRHQDGLPCSPAGCCKKMTARVVWKLCGDVLVLTTLYTILVCKYNIYSTLGVSLTC